MLHPSKSGSSWSSTGVERTKGEELEWEDIADGGQDVNSRSSSDVRDQCNGTLLGVGVIQSKPRRGACASGRDRCNAWENVEPVVAVRLDVAPSVCGTGDKTRWGVHRGV